MNKSNVKDTENKLNKNIDNSHTSSEDKKHLKILAIGDLHGDSRQASKLAEYAAKQKVDLVIISGDLTFAEQSVDYLVGPFAKRKLNTVFVPGNHETIATANFLAKQYEPYAKNIHGEGEKVKGIGIFGVGSANIGLFQLSEKEIYDSLKKGFDKVRDTKLKIMVSHVHPSESQMSKMTNWVPGSSGVKRAIEKLKPDIAICSHAHEAEGIEEMIGDTRVINVGRRGKIIEI
jgi:Icc-related predicted phosphoesterase